MLFLLHGSLLARCLLDGGRSLRTAGRKFEPGGSIWEKPAGENNNGENVGVEGLEWGEISAGVMTLLLFFCIGVLSWCCNCFQVLSRVEDERGSCT